MRNREIDARHPCGIPKEAELGNLGDILRQAFGGQDEEAPWASFRADLADTLMRIKY